MISVKPLRNTTNARRYVSNHTFHSDLRIPHVRTVFQDRIATHRFTLALASKPANGTTVTPASK
jgi:hypothetical protein